MSYVSILFGCNKHKPIVLHTSQSIEEEEKYLATIGDLKRIVDKDDLEMHEGEIERLYNINLKKTKIRKFNDFKECNTGKSQICIFKGNEIFKMVYYVENNLIT